MAKKIDTNYVSPLDTFLAKFDEENPHKSESQKQEIKKYQRIYQLRDDATAEDMQQCKLWDAC